MRTKKILSVVAAVAMACTCGVAGIACGEDDGVNSVGNLTSAYNIPDDNCRTYYEIFVRSFADGNGDGIGDLQGLIDNLDYLNDGKADTDTDLGINGIWLMPIQKAGSYHKYDTIDYMSIDPEYGTLNDFDELVSECDKRGIAVQIDLVINHTSNKHPWFLQAVNDAKMGMTPEESEYMSRYMFYRKDERPTEGTYSDVSGSNYCYLANFSSTQPDLNLENDYVKDYIKSVVDFWVDDHGVSSFRLDAVPWGLGYSASDCGQKNIEFWTWFNNYCKGKGCYNVGEVWADGGCINEYFGTGMSAFNFPNSQTNGCSFVNVVKGSGSRGAEGLAVTLAKAQAAALEKDSAALLSNFISNHDNDRFAGALESDAVKIKKAAGLYLLSPGNPYIYYGEEIGAKGSGNDPNKRLPFNWGDSKHDEIDDPPGATYSEKQLLGSVKSQTADPASILSYYREAIKIRNRFPEIGRGVMTAYAVNKSGELKPAEAVHKENKIDLLGAIASVNALNKTLYAYTLKYGDEQVLIVQNAGTSSATVKASDFSGYKIVGQLKADGGSVSFMSNSHKLTISAGVAVVLKK